jgi:hypothetical protein
MSCSAGAALSAGELAEDVAVDAQGQRGRVAALVGHRRRSGTRRSRAGRTSAAGRRGASGRGPRPRLRRHRLCGASSGRRCRSTGRRAGAREDQRARGCAVPRRLRLAERERLLHPDRPLADLGPGERERLPGAEAGVGEPRDEGRVAEALAAAGAADTVSANAATPSASNLDAIGTAAPQGLSRPSAAPESAPGGSSKARPGRRSGRSGRGCR